MSLIDKILKEAFEDSNDNIEHKLDTYPAIIKKYAESIGLVVDDMWVEEQNQSIVFNITKSHDLNGLVTMNHRKLMLSFINKLDGVDFVNFDDHILRVDL